MTPLSGAERAKRFRERNKTRVREQDVLRKRHKRLMMKVKNPVKNEEGYVGKGYISKITECEKRLFNNNSC